eukprot:scaffold82817_cov36-Phaeocystis_antarctica.AAC.1
MPEARESNALQSGPEPAPPLTSLKGGAPDAPEGKLPKQEAADAGRRWSSRAPKTIARFVAEAAPPPSFLRTMVEREGVVPSDVSTTSAAPSLKPSIKPPHGGAQRKARGAPPPPPEPSQPDPDPTLRGAGTLLLTAATDAALDAVTHRCPKGCGYTTTKSKAMGGHSRACPLRGAAPTPAAPTPPAPTPAAHDPAGDEPGAGAAPRASAPGATAGSDSEDDQPLSERPRAAPAAAEAAEAVEAEAAAQEAEEAAEAEAAAAEAAEAAEAEAEAAEAQAEAPQELQQEAPPR